jgi:multiple sugar transport system ATP-binding protein
MEIYTRPATAFVAGFVGTPTMNFVPVEIDEALSQWAEVKLPDGCRLTTRIAKSSLTAQTKLTFGIRAESVRITGQQAGDTKGRALFVERLGDRTLVYLELAEGSTIVAEDAGMSRVAIGDVVGLKFDGGAAHLFDEEHGYHAMTAVDD